MRLPMRPPIRPPMRHTLHSYGMCTARAPSTVITASSDAHAPAGNVTGDNVTGGNVTQSPTGSPVRGVGVPRNDRSQVGAAAVMRLQSVETDRPTEVGMVGGAEAVWGRAGGGAGAVGIGVLLHRIGSEVQSQLKGIVRPMGSAEKDGRMQAGDILLAVDASAIDAVSLDGITELVCGAEGSSVLLKMMRTSNKQAAARSRPHSYEGVYYVMLQHSSATVYYVMLQRSGVTTVSPPSNSDRSPTDPALVPPPRADGYYVPQALHLPQIPQSQRTGNTMGDSQADGYYVPQAIHLPKLPQSNRTGNNMGDMPAQTLLSARSPPPLGNSSAAPGLAPGGAASSEQFASSAPLPPSTQFSSAMPFSASLPIQPNWTNS
ncbi:hypothetical protein T484DRAFT_1880769, partial [Baffinella frigidus]